MPTYEYRREDGTTFEIRQRITADALETCPETGQKVERVISAAGLIFKGEGFYVNDYAQKGKSKTNETSDGSDSSSTSESKTESSSTSNGSSSDKN